MSTPRLTFVSNPAAIGAEWLGEDGTTRWQIAVARGSSQVLFGGGGYPTTVMVEPERFGPIPTDRKSMLAYAEAFLAAGEGGEDE